MSRNLGPLLIILVVIAVAVGVYKFEHRASDLTLVTEANKGAIVNGFPADLVLPEDAKISKSALYDASNGDRVVLTEYSTKASLSDLFAGFVSYLSNSGYTLEDTQFRAVSSSIAAKNGEREVRVDVSLGENGEREVVVEVRDTMK